MPYSKQDWNPDASGNPKYVTPSRMNHIETGIENVTNVAEQNASDISELNSNLVELEGNVSDIDKATTTNLLNPSLQSQVINGVTISANGDGTYTLNGTPSTEFNINIGTITCLIGKTYRLVGRPAGAGADQSAFAVYCDTGQIDYGSGVNFVPVRTAHNIILYLHPNIGTLSNVVIKPMVSTNLSISYDDFIYYTGDKGKLNSDVSSVRRDFDSLKTTLATTVAEAIKIEANVTEGVQTTYNFLNGLEDGTYLIIAKTHVDKPLNKRLFMSFNDMMIGANILNSANTSWQWQQTAVFSGTSLNLLILSETNLSETLNFAIQLIRLK